MIKLPLTFLVAFAIVFPGCAAKTQDRSQQAGEKHSDSRAAPADNLHPTKLENCVTAVGANRTQCVAKEK